MFVDTSRVAVIADGEIDVKDVTPDMDVIYIRKKMDYGTTQQVIGAATKITPLKPRGNGADDGDNGDESESATESIDLGAYNMALLIFNILAWSGPSFTGVACVPKHIRRLDPDEPIVGQVLASINARNVRKKDRPDPKSSTSAGA